MSIINHFQQHREWESLTAEEITFITFENGHYDLPQECTIIIVRDNQFNLKATISGIINHRTQLDPKGPEIPGTYFETENIIGYDNRRLFKYKLFGVVIGKSTIQPHSLEETTSMFTADLLFNSYKKAHCNYEGKIESIQDWFLSGKTNVSFSRKTKRKIEANYQKARIQIDLEEVSDSRTSSGSSSDFLYISTPDLNFIVAKVPVELGPDWSFNMCIEYRNSLSEIPNAEERLAISEFVGFVLGTHLLHVGNTAYDSNFSIISQEFNSPWGDNVISKCAHSGLPPTEISSWNLNQAELILNELLPEYLNKRKKYHLNDVMWKYWIARDSAVGSNLPIFASAIESLAELVLKEHPHVKHYYIEYKEFQKIINTELISIEESLKSYTFKEKIINKIKGASQRGSGERLDIFFDIIQLKIGDIERKAIKARNKMAHSSLGEVSRTEMIELAQITSAYQTLFHRVLLKLLGYKGQYIDYYSVYHPLRDINDVIPTESNI